MPGSISNRSLAPGSVMWGQKHNVVSYVPPTNDIDFVATSEDISGFSVGDPIPLDGIGSASGYLPMPMSLYFTQTDAASDTLTTTWTITGRNQFGEDVYEDVTCPPGTGVNNISSVWCYSFVSSVVLAAVTGLAASDTIAIGTDGNTTLDFPVPLPFKPKNADAVLLAAVNGLVWTGATITTSTVYSTITLANAGDTIALAYSAPVTIAYVNGAWEAY